MAEPPYGIIWNEIKEGNVVPFLGAGASFVGRPEDKKDLWLLILWNLADMILICLSNC